jgi:hypothetical protein
VTRVVPGVQNHGEVFTRRWVVEVLLDLTGYTADGGLGSLRLVEPFPAGSSSFVIDNHVKHRHSGHSGLFRRLYSDIGNL